MPANNIHGLNVKTFKHNYTVHMYGIPVVLQGYTTTLTLNDKKSGEYSVLLTNGYGEYYHKFQLPEGILKELNYIQ